MRSVVLGCVLNQCSQPPPREAKRRYRQQQDVPAQRFRMSVTIGGDAIAMLAIVLQFFPILLVPLCA
jgi:hypothetical protein